MAGLIAASILRRHAPSIYEAAPSLPNNHEALLRFRTPDVSKATGIPFEKVRVQKAIAFEGQILTSGNLRLSNMYSQKVTDKVMGRSIDKLESEDRFIAPDDFVGLLSVGANIHYSKALDLEMLEASADSGEPIISTIPMPVLMKIVGWEKIPDFQFQAIHTLTCQIDHPDVKVFQTLYSPDSEDSWYRASLTGSRLIIEALDDYQRMASMSMWQEEIRKILALFGIFGATISDVRTKTQKFGKIVPISNKDRMEFIQTMTDRYNLYSLGRFATWKQILLDDLVKDVETIEKFMGEKSRYLRTLHASR